MVELMRAAVNENANDVTTSAKVGSDGINGYWWSKQSGRKLTDSNSRMQRKCLLLIAFILCNSSSITQMTFAQQKFCGKALTDAMDLVCINGYKGYGILPSVSAIADATNTDADYSALVQMQLNPSLATALVMLQKRQVSPMLAKMLLRTRIRRNSEGGVYDECCLKACSYSELATYCRIH